MDYCDVQKYLDSVGRMGSVPGLTAIKALLLELKNPEKNLKVIHIAGTNGKGSTGAFIDKILTNAGLTTGRYSSPAVMEPLEIIRINGKNIGCGDFSEVVTEVRAARERLAEDNIYPTRFEVETASAFLFFSRKKVDVAIIECGMGGLLDATNVFEEVLCSVITSISMDHTDFLGDTLEKIAFNKAGIIKDHCPVVTCNRDEAVAKIIEQEATLKKAPLIQVKDAVLSETGSQEPELIFSYEEYENLKCGLKGIYQTVNAATAIEAVKVLKNSGYDISDDNIRDGIENTYWPGRFEIIHNNPLVITDGAHNPDGARALSETLRYYFGNKKHTFLIGIFKDKDIYGILDEIMDLADNVIVIETPGNIRAADCEHVASIIKERYNINAEPFKDVKDGVLRCLELCTDSVVTFGSLSNIKRIKEIIKNDYRR